MEVFGVSNMIVESNSLQMQVLKCSSSNAQQLCHSDNVGSPKFNALFFYF